MSNGNVLKMSEEGGRRFATSLASHSLCECVCITVESNQVYIDVCVYKF